MRADFYQTGQDGQVRPGSNPGITNELGLDHERLTVRSQGLDFGLTGVLPAKTVKGILV